MVNWHSMNLIYAFLYYRESEPMLLGQWTDEINSLLPYNLSKSRRQVAKIFRSFSSVDDFKIVREGEEIYKVVR
jgi:hypothetical protein